jgi:hypothetical protein
VGSYQTTTTTLDDGEISTIETALVLYLAHAQRELAKDPAAPFSSVDHWIEGIRKRLDRGVIESKLPASDMSMSALPNFTVTVRFGLDESGLIDEALTHYRAHCQSGGAQSSFSAQHEYIESIRRKLPRPYAWL